MLASMMGLVTDPVGHFNRPVEPPSTAEVFRETSATPAVLISDEIGPVESSVESSFSAEVFRKTRAAPASLVSDQVGPVEPSVEPPFTAEVFRETSAAPAVTSSHVRTGGEEPWGEKLRVLLATPAVLVLAALVVFAVLAAILWRSFRNHTSNSPVQAMVEGS